MSFESDFPFRGKQRDVSFYLEGRDVLIWSFVEPETDDPTGEDYPSEAERDTLETALWAYIDDYHADDYLLDG